MGVMGTGIGGGGWGEHGEEKGRLLTRLLFQMDSSLVKTKAPGFERCSGTSVNVTDKVTAGCLGGRDDVQPLS